MIEANRRKPAGGEYWFAEGCYITELSNSEVDPEVSIARARVCPGDVTRWHSLKDTTERYVILEGMGEAEIGDATPRRVLPGDVVLIKPGERQRIRNLGREDLVFLAICSPRFEQENYQDLQGG